MGKLLNKIVTISDLVLKEEKEICYKNIDKLNEQLEKIAERRYFEMCINFMPSNDHYVSDTIHCNICYYYVPLRCMNRCKTWIENYYSKEGFNVTVGSEDLFISWDKKVID